MLVDIIFFVYLHLQSNTGALAHLARALDWQSKGDEFESRMLHSIKSIRLCKSFFLLYSLFCFFPYLCASE